MHTSSGFFLSHEPYRALCAPFTAAQALFPPAPPNPPRAPKQLLHLQAFATAACFSVLTLCLSSFCATRTAYYRPGDLQHPEMDFSQLWRLLSPRRLGWHLARAFSLVIRHTGGERARLRKGDQTRCLTRDPLPHEQTYSHSTGTHPFT